MMRAAIIRVQFGPDLTSERKSNNGIKQAYDRTMRKHSLSMVPKVSDIWLAY